MLTDSRGRVSDAREHALERFTLCDGPDQLVYDVGDFVPEPRQHEYGLFAGQAQRFAVITFLENQWQHTHTDQIRAVNALKALGDNGLDA